MSTNIKYSKRGQLAKNYFLQGYNCTQSVVLAYEDLFDMDRNLLLRMSSGFGGGMGRLREVCGALSGVFMVIGALYGYDEAKDYEGKKELYARIQELASRYKDIQGSIVCREILGLSKGADAPVPEKRTEEYYKKRPCPDIVGMAATILEEYLEEVGYLE